MYYQQSQCTWCIPHSSSEHKQQGHYTQQAARQQQAAPPEGNPSSSTTMPKQRNLRKRPAEEEADEADDGTPEVQKDLLHDLKLLQKQRKRVAGVDANKLVPAAASDDDEAAADNELMDAQYVKAVETNKSQIMDESTHMEQFVERELAKRLGKSLEDGQANLTKHEKQELELYQMPEGFEVGAG